MLKNCGEKLMQGQETHSWWKKEMAKALQTEQEIDTVTKDEEYNVAHASCHLSDNRSSTSQKHLQQSNVAWECDRRRIS